MEMSLHPNNTEKTLIEELFDAKVRIKYLEREVLRLGGGVRCPHCSTWEDIAVEQQKRPCYKCGGLGYYLPREEE